MNKTSPQTIEPSHFCGPEAGREHFALQPVILGIERYHLNIMANMLHRVGFAIIRSEWRLTEAPRHFGMFYFIQKRWSGSSSQRTAHGIQSCIMMPAPISMGRVMMTSHGFMKLIPWPTRITTMGQFSSVAPSIVGVIRRPLPILPTMLTFELNL